MPSLLSNADLVQAQSALEDVMDTFFTLPITYRKAVDMPDRWGEKKSEQFTEYELFAFFKESNNQTDTVDSGENGAYDVNDGYFLFSFLKLQDEGLIVNGLPALNPATDYIVANDEVYEVLAVPPLGFFVERFEVVKIIVKKVPNRV